MKTKLALVLSCLSVAVTLGAARAGTVQNLGTLSPHSARLDGWGGTWVNQFTPAPEACNLPGNCDVFAFDSQFDGALAAKHQTVQVGIQWKPQFTAESEGEYDTFDLYVYGPDGQLVASSVTPVRSSAGIASTAQVVNIPAPIADGVYQVFVVPFNVNAVPRHYDGVIMLQDLPVARADDHRPRLPDLVSLQPTNFKFASGALSVTKVENTASPCYPEETAQDGTDSDAVLDPTAKGPTRCLRFDAGHANLGDGPFYLDVDLGTGTPTTYQGLPTIGGVVEQILEHADGTETASNAGNYYFHIAHGHIHYKNFATYGVYRVDAHGERTGAPLVSKKSDFCMIDVDSLWFGRPGAQPRNRHFPQCNALDLDRLQETGAMVQRQGIDQGWADWYTWDLPGQYIDFTNLPDGVYDVVNTVNPVGALIEGDSANDSAFTRIDVHGEVVSCIAVPDAPCPLGTVS